MEFKTLTIDDVPSFNKWECEKSSKYLFEWYWNIDEENNEWYAVSAQYQPDDDEVVVSASTYNELRGMGDLISADYSSTHNTLNSALNTVKHYVEKIEAEKP